MYTSWTRASNRITHIKQLPFLQRSLCIQAWYDCGHYIRLFTILILPTVSIYCVVWQQMFSRCFAETSVFSNWKATRPDIVIIDENNRNVFILEVGCCFDSCLEEAYKKLVKYNPVVQQKSGLGYKSQYLVLIFGSLGHMHRLDIRGLRVVGFTKARVKQLAKYCSISSIIGSCHIWRRRCVYPSSAVWIVIRPTFLDHAWAMFCICNIYVLMYIYYELRT